MKRWSMIGIIVFILLFVLSIMTSKTEVVQLDHGSGVGVKITHDKKLLFIHSFQLEIYNGTGQTIAVRQPVSSFTLHPGGSFPDLRNDEFEMESLEPGDTANGLRESIWRISDSFHLTAVIEFEMTGQQQAIEISERLGASK